MTIRRNALVTGGTDGVGKEVARQLANQGHNLLIVGRDAQKGDRAERELRESTRNENVQFVQADLSLVSEANRLADLTASRLPDLHYLVHSAGIVRDHRLVTSEGIEQCFAVNYLTRFVLTRRLLPQLENTGRPGRSARIVIVGGAGMNGTINYDDVNLTTKFNMINALRQFQYANDVFTVELARRIEKSGQRPAVTIACFNPGVVNTNIRKDFPIWMKLLTQFVLDPLLGKAPERAAQAALSLLLEAEFEGDSGALYSYIKKFRRLTPSEFVTNPKEGQRLWELSEHLTEKAVRDRVTLSTSN